MRFRSFLTIFTESHNSFETKEPDETVIVLIRRHPFYIIAQTIFFFILLFVPMSFGVVFGGFVVSNGLTDLYVFLYFLWCLLLWQWIFYSITMYTLDVWIVTDKRIIDSTQHGFFNRTTSELHLTKIQDISVKIDGLIQTFFRFGDLEVQTAGTEEKFRFLQIPNPGEVKNKIMSSITSHPANAPANL